jgi:plastocyanin
LDVKGRRTRILLLAALAALAALAPAVRATGSDRNAHSSKAKRVSVLDDRFSPKKINVSVGGTVTWTWKGSNDHNVTFRKVPNGASKRRARTRSSGHFTRSFSKQGSYRYVCTIHEALGMRGTVVAG